MFVVIHTHTLHDFPCHSMHYIVYTLFGPLTSISSGAYCLILIVHTLWELEI